MARTGKNHAFIDGANLHKGVSEQGWRLDYRRFRVFLRDKYGVEKAYLFLGYRAEFAGLYRDLQNWGYTLIFKPTLSDHKGEIKGNCDAELVLQAMIDFAYYEKAVLVTGDGDFHCLVQYLEKQGKLAEVVAPYYKKCSVLLTRAVPTKLIFLDRFRSRLELKTGRP